MYNGVVVTSFDTFHWTRNYLTTRKDGTIQGTITSAHIVLVGVLYCLMQLTGRDLLLLLSYLPNSTNSRQRTHIMIVTVNKADDVEVALQQTAGDNSRGTSSIIIVATTIVNLFSAILLA